MGDEQQINPASEEFLVVVIGCSAGGLPALRELFRSCSDCSQMMFIVAQHMTQGFETKLPEILAKECKHTDLTVRLAENGLRLQEKQVLVIPPGVGALISNQSLQLVRLNSGGQHHMIDELFCSVAGAYGAYTAGVLLSGSGHDGTLGLSSIRDHGGLTLCQDEASAEFSEMPLSAIKNDIIDRVLSPKDIFAEISRYKKQLISNSTTHHQSELSTEQRDRIFRALRAHTGVDFSNYRMETVFRRLSKRLLVSDTQSIQAYIDLLATDPEEVEALYQDLLINVTSFFRDPNSFDTLSSCIFPKLVNNTHSESPIRVWVPGCSTGEEAYSIAIALTEYLESQSLNLNIMIFATDIDDHALNTARVGRYTMCSLTSVPDRYLQKYFEKSDESYQVSKELRELCVFARQDVIHDPPFSKLDLISCRNLFIYFNQQLQRRVLSTFHYALKPGRYLFLGPSESIGTDSALFSPVSKEHRIFVRQDIASERLPVPKLNPQINRQPSWRPAYAKPTESAQPKDLASEVHELLLPRIKAARVVVNEQLNVVFMEGPVERFLQLPTGTANLNILKMARAGLGLELRAAIQKASRQRTPVERADLLLSSGESRGTFDLEVIPFTSDSSGDNLFLLILSESRQQIDLPDSGHLDKSVEFKQMEQELIVTREFVQSVVEKQDSVAEELKAANEEVMTRNEELQSANEELETTKEELQAGNEELTTVNDELYTRNQELVELNAAFKSSEEKYRSLSESASDAIITVDSEGSILMWNQAAEATFGYSAQEAIGTNIMMIMPTRYRAGHLAGMKRVAKGDEPRIIGRTVELDGMRKDGSEFPIEISLSQWQSQNKTYFTSIIRDISVRVWAKRLQIARLEISKIILEANSIDEALIQALRIICQQMDFKVAVFWKHNSNDDRLSWDTMWPSPVGSFEMLSQLNSTSVFPREEKSRGMAWDTTSMWIQNLQLDTRFSNQKALENLGLQTSITFPLGSGADFFGLVEVFSISQLKPNQNVLALLDDIGSYLNHFIRRKLAEEKVQKLVHELESRVEERTKALTATEKRTRFLADTSLLLASSVDYGTTVQEIANLCVPTYADWCVVTVFAENERAQHVAVAHVDPEKVELAYQLSVDYPSKPDAPAGPSHVRRTGQSEVIEQIGEDVLSGVAQDERHLSILKELSLKSYACVPMKARGVVLGAVTLIYSDSNRVYSKDEIPFVEEIAHRAALAVDQARLLREAQSANQAKDEFLATLSHELRTPMNVILGWVEILRGDRDNETIDSGLEMLERNTNMQIKLIDDLIDISRITTGKLPVELAPLDLKQVVGSAIRDLKGSADAKGVEMKFGSTDSEVVVTGDNLRLHQVLQNLLNNAIKFTPKGGLVEVHLTSKDHNAHIVVKDSGVGIDPEFLPHVFDTFKQEDGSTTRSHGGLGLGLTISKYLIEQQKGRIEVTSEGKDKGATFTVIIPLNTQAPKLESEKNQTTKSAVAHSTAKTLAEEKILVIDDSPDILQLMERKLKRWGAEVYLARSAKAGFEHIAKNQFDLILCDIGMPEQDGLSFIKELRARKSGNGSKTPTIALTAYARIEEIQVILEAGFDRHLAKPVTESELLDNIIEVIRT